MVAVDHNFYIAQRVTKDWLKLWLAMSSFLVFNIFEKDELQS